MYDSTTYPDNLGLNQTRVLDSAGRSFESVIYQRKKPPLSCEVNLTGRLMADHAQEVFSSTMPSGWEIVGNIRANHNGQAEQTAYAGDVICSTTYPANNFKLMANDLGVATGRLVAWVAGHRLLIQGTNNLLDENNVISLGAPPSGGNRVDFVFLEAWRKLVTTVDPIYKNGNILNGTTNYENDLIDPAINIETSLRVQVQYRIRVAEIDMESFPSGFDPNLVFMQGPLDNPVSGSQNYFKPVPGDPGLWRAGQGDTASQDELQTVDGYTYAIPMFAVARRSTTPFNPQTHSNGAGRSLADFLAGKASDRPDNAYSDFIDVDDFLDMRHKITPVENGKELCERYFRQLLKGNIRGKMERVTLGEDHYGAVITQVDGISTTNPGYFTRIGIPNSVQRTYCKGHVIQQDTLDVKTTGSPWLTSNTAVLSAPAGATVQSVDSLFVTGTKATYPMLGDIMVAGGGGDHFEYSTDNGVTWNDAPTSIAFSIGQVTAITVAPSGFVAVGTVVDFGSEPAIFGTIDGIAWNLLASPSQFLNAVTWNTDTLVAVGVAGLITYSLNAGSTWTEITVNGNDFQSVAWGNGQFVATVLDALNPIYTSPDGITWTPQAISGNPGPALVGIVWDGTKYITVGSLSGNFASYTSPEGVNWTATSPGASGLFKSVAATTSVAIAVGSDKTIYYSNDSGTTWTQVVTQLGGDTLNSVTWDGASFIAGGDSNIQGKSSNGISWTFTNPFTTSGNLAIASSSYSVAGLGSTTAVITLTTTDFASYPLTINYTLDFPAGSGASFPGEDGFSRVPINMLEVRTIDATRSIACTDQDIRVRNMDQVVIAPDTTSFNMLSNRGGAAFGFADFGHQMSYHVPGNSSTTLVFPRKIAGSGGYDILGVASVFETSFYHNVISLSRDSNNYTLISDTTFAAGADVVLGLYTGDRFFATDNQIRGIVDSYQMIEYATDKTGDGVNRHFHINTGNKKILDIASNETYSGHATAYVNGTQKILDDINTGLDTTEFIASINFPISDPAPAFGSTIIVPTLVESPLDSTGYLFFYKALPYQGWLTDSPATGSIEAEGLAITTTAGCGASIEPQNPRNIIDRMPSANGFDWSGECGYNSSISEPATAYTTRDTRIITRFQDAIDIPSDALMAGIDPAVRGRAGVFVDGPLSSGNLGLGYESFNTGALSTYHKTYQSYLLNRDNSGELYLMVVASETGNTSGDQCLLDMDTNSDTVDIFKLPGRPLTLRKKV